MFFILHPTYHGLFFCLYPTQSPVDVLKLLPFGQSILSALLLKFISYSYILKYPTLCMLMCDFPMVYISATNKQSAALPEYIEGSHAPIKLICFACLHVNSIIPVSNLVLMPRIRGYQEAIIRTLTVPS